MIDSAKKYYLKQSIQNLINKNAITCMKNIKIREAAAYFTTLAPFRFMAITLIFRETIINSFHPPLSNSLSLTNGGKENPLWYFKERGNFEGALIPGALIVFIQKPMNLIFLLKKKGKFL